MKRLPIFVIIFCSLGLSSCLDVVEEVFLNKDGSGHYMITYDMGGLFSNPMLKGIMEESMKEGNDSPFSTNGELEKDSTVFFKDDSRFDIMKDYPTLYESAKMVIELSEAKEKMLMTMEFDFEELEEVSHFFEMLSESGSGNPVSEMAGGMGFNPASGKLQFEKKKLIRTAMELPAKEEGAEDEEMGKQMMKMFMSDATYKVVYHLPGKVKKSSMTGADVKKKTVTVEYPMLDLIDGKAKMEGEIRFK